MSRQIQVSDSVYKRLKGLADDNYRTIGGQIEFMMDNQSEPKPVITPKEYKPGDIYDPLSPPKKSEATPRVSDLFADPNNGEKFCCLNENKLCQHWVWDISTGEGYKNSLSGRFMEVE